jgi:hypothetical protein
MIRLIGSLMPAKCRLIGQIQQVKVDRPSVIADGQWKSCSGPDVSGGQDHCHYKWEEVWSPDVQSSVEAQASDARADVTWEATGRSRSDSGCRITARLIQPFYGIRVDAMALPHHNTRSSPSIIIELRSDGGTVGPVYLVGEHLWKLLEVGIPRGVTPMA